MAVSFGFKQALKSRTRRSRRIRVISFFGLVAVGLLYAGHPWSWFSFAFQALTYLTAFIDVYRDWRWSQHLPVSSLDDRAMSEYGMEFEKLCKRAQESILQRYRVGTYIQDYFPDERQVNANQEAHVRAYEIIRLVFPVIALLYWAGWRLLPEGRLRAGWTDGPVVMVWVGLLVVAMPQIIQMWNEPDEVGCPKIVKGGQEFD